MNLIEELGGYKAAKEKYESRPFALAWSDIGEALLDHRRQHGIYEKGDKIVYPWIGNEICVYDSECIIKTPYRHATDSEIAAGHRID
mgnify:CR=1 FL=1